MTAEGSRSRTFSDQLIEWVRGKGRILIVAHDNPDPDSLASAFALQHLFLVKAGQEATIAFGGVIGRGENRAMVHELEIGAVPIDGLDLDQYGVVCMVDTQPGTGNNSFPAGRRVHVVIDHHPLRIEAPGPWVDVRENYGASATILFEYLVAQDVYLSTKLATILFYAIKSETQDLGREWCRADREAYLSLLPLANNRILFNITHPKSPRAYFFSFYRALKNARIFDRVLVFNLYDIEIPDMVAEMADFLLRMEGIEVVLGMGRYGEKEILSLRTSDLSLKAGEALHRVVDGLGSAGGHGMTAGGQIRSMQGSKAAQRELEETLTRRLLKTLGMPLVYGAKLIPS
ncbi:MAG: phosphoesterase [Desulfuromonas sp.]|uniref:DHH family phosphoesterase n=1 Tax=Desulfuromonas sp. TaxID=892 RepID=UPI000CB87D4D|nr:bifunctional oligoribonuclease/PAP phosphatase NrnA [Desulfuromonas sp.]PLX82804.1 MAG: phosphoesterase [Desulfuromonas sp.]